MPGAQGLELPWFKFSRASFLWLVRVDGRVAAQILGLEMNRRFHFLYSDFWTTFFSSLKFISVSKCPDASKFWAFWYSTILCQINISVLTSQCYKVSYYFSIYFVSSRKYSISIIHFCFFPAPKQWNIYESPMLENNMFYFFQNKQKNSRKSGKMLVIVKYEGLVHWCLQYTFAYFN